MGAKVALWQPFYTDSQQTAPTPLPPGNNVFILVISIRVPNTLVVLVSVNVLVTLLVIGKIKTYGNLIWWPVVEKKCHHTGGQWEIKVPFHWRSVGDEVLPCKGNR